MNETPKSRYCPECKRKVEGPFVAYAREDKKHRAKICMDCAKERANVSKYA